MKGKEGQIARNINERQRNKRPIVGDKMKKKHDEKERSHERRTNWAE